MKEQEEFKFDFDKDTTIDPNRLHEECFNYSNMAWKYAEAWADAKKEMDIAHEKVKVTRSQLILKARQNPEDCGLAAKPTNDAIEAYYRNHPDHKEAKDDLIEKEYRHNILQGGLNAIQFSKSTALEGAIRMWEKEYFTIPGLPVEVPKTWHAWRETERTKTTDKQRKRMKRTTRPQQEDEQT